MLVLKKMRCFSPGVLCNGPELYLRLQSLAVREGRQASPGVRNFDDAVQGMIAELRVTETGGCVLLRNHLEYFPNSFDGSLEVTAKQKNYSEADEVGQIFQAG